MTYPRCPATIELNGGAPVQCNSFADHSMLGHDHTEWNDQGEFLWSVRWYDNAPGVTVRGRTREYMTRAEMVELVNAERIDWASMTLEQIGEVAIQADRYGQVKLLNKARRATQRRENVRTHRG